MPTFRRQHQRVLQRFAELTGVKLQKASIGPELAAMLYPPGQNITEVMKVANDQILRGFRRGARMELSNVRVIAKRATALPLEVQEKISDALDHQFNQDFWEDNFGKSTRRRLANVLFRSMQEGWTLQETADFLRQDRFGIFSIDRALRIARTECLPGDATVNAADVTAIYRRWYSGPLIQIVTKSGREFSCTANHPVLTPQGWRAAGELQVGANLVCDRRHGKLSSSTGNVNVKNPPITISEIFDSLSAVFVTERFCGRKPDFHGDGRDSDVDILRPNGILGIGNFTPISKSIAQNIFTPSDMCCVLAATSGQPFNGGIPVNQLHRFIKISDLDSTISQNSLNDAFASTMLTSQSFQGFSSQVPFCNRLFGNVLSDEAAISSIDQERSGICKTAAYPSRLTNRLDLINAKSSIIGNTVGTQPSQVEVDDVLFLGIRERWSGHVYNLTTIDGYFLSGGLYTGNTTGALNGGAWIARQEAIREGSVIGEEWNAILDSRLRNLHRFANGQVSFQDAVGRWMVRTIGGDIIADGREFVLGDERARYPGDPKLSAANRVNCRCVATAVV